MKMKKRLFSLLLTLCLALTLMPVSVAFAANEDNGDSSATKSPAVMPGGITTTTSVTSAHMTLQQLKDKFPDGRYWNGGDINSTTDSPCPTHTNKSYCNYIVSGGKGAWQCYGFALKLGEDAYGSSPRNWPSTTDSSYVDSLKPGDIVDSNVPYHTVFVIGVTDTDIIVGECNYGGRCLIKWGRPIPKSTVKTYSSLKIFIAPSALPTSNTTPTVTPEITLSQSSVSMQVSGSATITVGTRSPGAIYLKAYTSNSSVCGGSWGSWNSAGTTKPLTLTGQSVGTATVTVCMYDSSTNAELTRKTISVQVIPIPTSSGPQISVDTLTTLNSAGTASLYPTVFKGYLRRTSQYNAYSDSRGTNYIGHIYTSDELKVQSVYAYNGELWMSALCPWNGYSSDRLIYTKLDAVLDTSFTPYTAIASSAATVYTRSNAATKYGSLGSGDAVTVVGQSGQYSQVIYPLAVGGYKIGWCATSSLTRPNISSVTARSSTSVRLSYSLSANASNNLVIMDGNKNVILRGSISGSGVNVSGLTSGATYYIYVESKLSNGTGTVTSVVKKVVVK